MEKAAELAIVFLVRMVPVGRPEVGEERRRNLYGVAVVRTGT
jgi:hypothetical protein